MNKGQYYRLLLSPLASPNVVVAAAKQMQLHGSAQTEESSTKDTTGDAQEFEVVGLSYDITGSGLVLTPNDALLTGGVGLNDFEGWVKDQLLYWRICLMEGTNNRTIVEEIASGTGKLTNLQIQAQNKNNTTYNYTLTGYDALKEGSPTINIVTETTPVLPTSSNFVFSVNKADPNDQTVGYYCGRAKINGTWYYALATNVEGSNIDAEITFGSDTISISYAHASSTGCTFALPSGFTGIVSEFEMWDTMYEENPYTT